MDYREFLRKIPKVELHVHLNGTVRAQTIFELADKNDIPLPVSEPAKLYHFPYTSFFQTLQLVSSVVKDDADLFRITHEFLEDSVKYSNVRYVEIFLNPTLFPPELSYRTMLDGVVEGCRAAHRDFGIQSKLIPCIYRGHSQEEAQGLVDQIIEHREEEVVGIGLDGLECFGPPEKFAKVFETAREAGLHRTAHAGEDGPPENIETCLDLLSCERIDHGYAVLEKPSLVRRVRDEGVYFDVIIRAWAKYTGFEHHPVKEMDRQGILITIGSDDPPMQHGDLGLEYIDAAIAFNWGPDKMVQICLDSIDATWLSNEEKSRLRTEFETEINALRADGIENLPPAFLPYFRGHWWDNRTDVRTKVLSAEDV